MINGIYNPHADKYWQYRDKSVQEYLDKYETKYNPRTQGDMYMKSLQDEAKMGEAIRKHQMDMNNKDMLEHHRR
jgi:hypothetical protein